MNATLRFLVNFLCFCFVLVVVSSTTCDRTKCKGPLKHYKELNCKPIYETPDDCCAAKYDCSHFKNRSKDKCYLNGQVYQPGEKIDLPTSSCFGSCDCIKSDVAEMSLVRCPSGDCAYNLPRETCYISRLENPCCGNTVCPSSLDEVFKCNVDGKTVYEGQNFFPSSDPELSCLCMKGYTGINVEPFCKITRCNTEQHYPKEISENCAPIYDDGQSPRISCTYNFICDFGNVYTEVSSNSDEAMCKIGNSTMRVGDVIKKEDKTVKFGACFNKCVKCACEVPPTPTCTYASDQECGLDPSRKPNHDWCSSPSD